MSPEEVTELSPEEQVYFFLLEQHLMGIPDLEEPWVSDPAYRLGRVLGWLTVAAALCAPWAGLAVLAYVILT